MLTYALLVFVVAALGGLVLASFVLRGRFAPWAISVLHALLGAGGLVLLLLAVMQGAGSRANLALAVLVVAALGGFYLASLHLKRKLAMKKIVLVHAGAAVVGVLVLISAVLAQ